MPSSMGGGSSLSSLLARRVRFANLKKLFVLLGVMLSLVFFELELWADARLRVDLLVGFEFFLDLGWVAELLVEETLTAERLAYKE